MTLPAQGRDQAFLDSLRKELAWDYPDLRIVNAAPLYLEGGFPLNYEGCELDRFQVRILIPCEFPNQIPIVWETAARIPIHADWHTYDRGALCVIVPEEWLLRPESKSVLTFLDGPLRNYFLGHALAELGHKRPMGERQHGARGLLEVYGEWVGSGDADIIERYLEYLSMESVPRQWFCPCGSGQKLRRCHGTHFRDLKNKIPSRIASMALQRLRDQMKRERSGNVNKNT